MISLLLAIVVVHALLHRAGCDTLLVRAWSLVWVLSAAGAALVDGRPWDFSPAAAVLAGLTLCLGAGAALGGGRTEPPARSDPWRPVLSPGVHAALLFGVTLLSLLSVHLLLGDLGLGWAIFADPERLVAAAAAAAVARYQEDFNAEPSTRVLLIFMFLSAQLAGWYASRPIRGASRPLLCALAFVPPLAWTTLLTTKANVLMWLAFFAASWLAFGIADRRAAGGRRGWLLAGGAALALLMFGVQVARYGGDLEQAGVDATNALVGSAVGHGIALRDWIERGIVWWPDQLGLRSFAGVAEVLGVATRQIGLYTDDVVDVGPSSTNVYTALRPLLEDVGLVVAAALFVVFGWLGAVLERGAVGRPGRSALLAVMLAALFWSPITSLFNYNSLIACCLLFAGGAAALRAR